MRRCIYTIKSRQNGRTGTHGNVMSWKRFPYSFYCEEFPREVPLKSVNNMELTFGVFLVISPSIFLSNSRAAGDFKSLNADVTPFSCDTNMCYMNSLSFLSNIARLHMSKWAFPLCKCLIDKRGTDRDKVSQILRRMDWQTSRCEWQIYKSKR